MTNWQDRPDKPGMWWVYDGRDQRMYATEWHDGDTWGGKPGLVFCCPAVQPDPPRTKVSDAEILAAGIEDVGVARIAARTDCESGEAMKTALLSVLMLGGCTVSQPPAGCWTVIGAETSLVCTKYEGEYLDGCTWNTHPSGPVFFVRNIMKTTCLAVVKP